MDIGELRRQHQELGEIATQLSRAVANNAVPQSVGALRWQLARLLMGHLALEDRIFYPAVQRMADEHVRATAQRLQTEIAPLAGAFSAYMADWNEDRIHREWAGFCAETRDILDSLGSRIDKEERILYPLVNDSRKAVSPISRAGAV